MHDPIVIMTYSTIVTQKEYSTRKRKKKAGRKGKKIAKEQQPGRTWV
jgi:hypothetical protein